MQYLSSPWHFFVALTPPGRLALLISLFWVLIAVFGQFLAPYSINDIGGGPLFGRFSAHYWLGTDYLGRDILTRLLYGSRFPCGLALSAAVLARVAGALLADRTTVV